MGRWGSSILGLAILVSAAACTGKASAPHTSAADPWIRADLKPITQPAAVAHRFVLLDASGSDLQIMALDARTGRTVWKDTASTSDITQGEPPELIIIGSDVIYLRAAGGDAAELVSANAVDGKVIWKTDVRTFNGWPSICSDDASLVCATGPLGQATAHNASLLRFDARTGGLKSGTGISSAPGARELAPGLFDSGNRKPEQLVASSGANMAWTKPLAGIFTLHGASTDFGWNFARAERPGLFVGSPGWPPIRATSTTYTLDLTASMTAGFRIADGTPVWQNQGSQFVCGYLPCPGENLVPYRGPADASDPGPTIGLRLRMTGTVTGSQSGTGLPTASKDARAILEGFDLASGATTWSFDAGHQVDLLNQTLLPPLVGTRSILIAAKHGGVRLLDLSTGSASDPPDSLVAWCRSIVSYKHRSPTDNSLTDYIGQLALFPCDAGQHRIPAPVTVPGYVGSFGGASDGLVAWSDASSVVAVRQAAG